MSQEVIQKLATLVMIGVELSVLLIAGYFFS